MTVRIVQALTGIEKRVTARIDRAGALEAEAHRDRISRRKAGRQIQKIDIAVKNRIDDFNQIDILEFFLNAHDLARFFGPVHKQGLSGPSGARPVTSGTADGAVALCPDNFELLVDDIRRSPSGRITVIIAAKSQHAFDVGEPFRRGKGNGRVRRIVVEQFRTVLINPPGNGAVVCRKSFRKRAARIRRRCKITRKVRYG